MLREKQVDRFVKAVEEMRKWQKTEEYASKLGASRHSGAQKSEAEVDQLLEKIKQESIEGIDTSEVPELEASFFTNPILTKVGESLIDTVRSQRKEDARRIVKLIRERKQDWAKRSSNYDPQVASEQAAWEYWNGLASECADIIELIKREMG